MSKNWGHLYGYRFGGSVDKRQHLHVLSVNCATVSPFVIKCRGGTLTPRRCRGALRSALRSIGIQLSRSHCQLEDFLAHEDTLKT